MDGITRPTTSIYPTYCMVLPPQSGQPYISDIPFDAQPVANYTSQQDVANIGGVNVNVDMSMGVAVMPSSSNIMPTQVLVLPMPQQSMHPSAEEMLPYNGQAAPTWTSVAPPGPRDQPACTMEPWKQQSKALKIVNPYTHEEVRGKVHSPLDEQDMGAGVSHGEHTPAENSRVGGHPHTQWPSQGQGWTQQAPSSDVGAWHQQRGPISFQTMVPQGNSQQGMVGGYGGCAPLPTASPTPSAVPSSPVPVPQAVPSRSGKTRLKNAKIDRKPSEPAEKPPPPVEPPQEEVPDPSRSSVAPPSSNASGFYSADAESRRPAKAVTTPPSKVVSPADVAPSKAQHQREQNTSSSSCPPSSIKALNLEPMRYKYGKARGGRDTKDIKDMPRSLHLSPPPRPGPISQPVQSAQLQSQSPTPPGGTALHQQPHQPELQSQPQVTQQPQLQPQAQPQSQPQVQPPSQSPHVQQPQQLHQPQQTQQAPSVSAQTANVQPPAQQQKKGFRLQNKNMTVTKPREVIATFESPPAASTESREAEVPNPQEPAEPEPSRPELSEPPVITSEIVESAIVERERFSGADLTVATHDSETPAPPQEPTAAAVAQPHAEPREEYVEPENDDQGDVDEEDEEEEDEDEDEEDEEPHPTSSSLGTASQEAENITPTQPRGAPLRPTNGILDRTTMLRIWRAYTGGECEAVKMLRTTSRGEPERRPSTNRPEPKKPIKPRKEHPLRKSEKPYEPNRPATVSREETLERRTLLLLNKICPDNLNVIVSQLAEIDLHRAEEMECVIRTILRKALNEPHYSETYADMVYNLRHRYPEFPPEKDGEKAQTFQRVLLNAVQNEFECLLNSFEPTEEEKQKYNADEWALELKRRKERKLANMKFIGNLFVRMLLAVKVIGQVVHELIGSQLPEEDMIECACQLLEAIGHTLDGQKDGKTMMTRFFHRLMDLKQTTTKDGKPAYSMRIRFQIQDLWDMRQKNWEKKIFRDTAKTRDEIRKDATREGQKGTGSFATQTAGMRPAHVDTKSKGQRNMNSTMQASKPPFEEPQVRAMIDYFADQRNVDGLEQDWQEAKLNSKEIRKVVKHMLDFGFNDHRKEDACAEAIAVLLSKQMFSFDLFEELLACELDQLQELKIDVPQAEVFFHSLFAHLYMKTNRDFNFGLLKTLPMQRSQAQDALEVSQSLLFGGLRAIRSRQGAENVRKALSLGHGEIGQALCRALQCSDAEVDAQLRARGIL